MSHKVQLSQRARRDIEDAYRYIRRDSPERARNWRERLQADIQSLRHFPERHVVLFGEAAAGYEVRQRLFGVYCVLYTIRSDRVDVLTVRHSARRPIEPDELGQ
jgi:plasmid stabilization system protein ParE